MAEKDERTLRMMQEYIRLFEEGKSPKEIATMFRLTTTTVYQALYIIAEEAGVPRSALLERPHSEHTGYNRSFEPVKLVEPQRSFEFYEKTLELLENQLREVRYAIETIEEEERE